MNAHSTISTSVPAMTLRTANERGQVDFGWLKGAHSFSFGEYYDPNHMGFGPLRVINDDRIAGGGGFPMHPHRNMEIVTYMLEGALAHRDSLGNGAIIAAGDVQRMSAGKGIRHSEFNASEVENAHLLQIWMLPTETGLEPSYEDITIARAEKLNALRLIASPDGRNGAATIRTPVSLFASIIEDGKTISHSLPASHIGWVQVARGALHVNGQRLAAGDGLAIHQGGELVFTGTAPETEFLLFDMQSL